MQNQEHEDQYNQSVSWPFRSTEMGTLKTQFQQLDTNIFLWVQQKNICRDTRFHSIKNISRTGDGWLYCVVAAIALSIDWQTNLTFFYACLAAYSLQVPLYVLLKKKFKRNRPQDCLHAFTAKIIPSDQFSFPSGHTAAAFVMATQIMFFFPSLGLFALCWAIAIGFSRVLLGVHFPGDILAGISLGVLCTLLANQILVTSLLISL